MEQIEYDEEAFIPLRARLLATLDGLRTECPSVLGEHCQRAIRRAVSRACVLPPDALTFQRWFRAACRRADGVEYSRSQRALFVRQFDAVGRRWAEERLVGEPLQVTNYRRRRPGGVADPRVYQAVRPAEVRCLQERLLLRLEQGGEENAGSDEAHWEAFCRLAFALIVWGGMAWPGALAVLADLEWRHIRTAAQGFIRIPRRGVWLRLHVPPRVQAFALTLAAQLPRSRKFAEPDPSQPLLPLEIGDGDPEKRRACVTRRFNRWLQGLCQAADVSPIGLHTLQEAARMQVARMYSNVLAGAILGLTPYAPVADGQQRVFDTYRTTFALLPASPAPFAVLPGRRPTCIESAEETGDCRLEELVARLQDVLRPLLAPGSASRGETATALESLARAWLDAPGETDLAPAFAATREQVDADVFNVAVLAAWLAHLCRQTRLKPLTLAAYRSAGCALARHFTGLRWDELKREDVREIAGLPSGRATRSRLLVVLGQVGGYLSQVLGIQADGLAYVTGRLSRGLQQVNLIGLDDVERLLAHLTARREEALAEGDEANARLAHDAFLAVLLACFFGLRRGEVCRLRLGDMVLDARSPYLRIWRSKRGRSRVVWARHVPPAVLDRLHAEWRRRIEAAGGDPAALFLEYEEDEMAFAEMLGKTVNTAIRALGLEENPDALPVTFHTLRHVYANRLLALGVPLIEIARSLGHADTDTTASSYLHAFDSLQEERLREVLATQPEDGVTAAQIGALLGVKRAAALAALKQLPAAQREGWQRSERHLYPWATVVQLLARRLRLEDVRPQRRQRRASAPSTGQMRMALGV